MTPPTDFQRARRPEHKELRVSSILEAARLLGVRKGVREVTLTDIAAEAGINKSAVLRYFETREEIYLRLTAEGWTRWSAALREELGPGTTGTVARYAAAIPRTLLEQPLFCDLLAHASLNLERHVSRDAVLSFKVTTLGAVQELAVTTERFLPELGAAGARELISSASLLAASLWQISHPPGTLAELYAEKPELAHAVIDFAPKLSSLTAALATGLIERGRGERAVGELR